jgi:hypothetical protein
VRRIAGLLIVGIFVAPAHPTAAAAVPAASASASAAAGTLSTARDLVVDVPHAVTFASGYGDRGQGRVEVSDLDANPLAELTIASPEAMTMTADGTAVLVAQGDAASITSIDAATLAVTTIPLTPAYCPVDIAMVDGEAWIVSRCFGADSLAVVDIATGSVTPVTTDLDLDADEVQLSASPQLPGSVFVVKSSLNTVLTALTVTVTPPVGGVGPNSYSATVARQQVMRGTAEDISMAPDGSEIAIVGGLESIDRYSTSDLSLVGRRKRSGFTPTNVALGDGGRRVEVYNRNEEGSAQLILADGSVARTWSLSKGTGLYNMFGEVGLVGEDVLALQYRSFRWTLHRLPLRFDSTLSLSSKKVVGFRETFVLGVRRTGTSARKVTITATPADQPARVVGTIRLDQTGRGQLKLAATRNTKFTASVEGDATHLPASKVRRVQVRGPAHFRIAGHHRVIDGYVRLGARETATLVTEIPRSQIDSCAYVTIQYKTSGTWRYLAGTDCMPLPESRVVKVKFRAFDYQFARGKPLRMRSAWYGDAWYAGSQSKWTYARFG